MVYLKFIPLSRLSVGDVFHFIPLFGSQMEMAHHPPTTLFERYRWRTFGEFLLFYFTPEVSGKIGHEKFTVCESSGTTLKPS